MSKRKHSRVIAAFSATLLLSLALAGGASADTSSQELAPGALTTPPPVEMNLNTVSPKSTLLSSVSANLLKLSSSMEISANTYATQTVSLIGADYVFQRWTGSVWIDVDNATGSSSNSNSYYGTKRFSATTGYYYRGKTVHYAKNGSTNEQQIYYTQSLLMGQ